MDIIQKVERSGEAMGKIKKRTRNKENRVRGVETCAEREKKRGEKEREREREIKERERE